MKVIHNVSIHVSGETQAEFHKAGIAVNLGFSTFRIDEDDARWPEIAQLVTKFDAVDVVLTKFSVAELSNAAALGIVPTWHHGYPMPDDDWGYLEATFDLSEYCPECGSGLQQIAPFQMKREPRWKSNSILQLNWVFDEYFVKPEVWNSLFKPIGIDCLPVLSFRGKQELNSVVQLKIPRIVDLFLDGFEYEICRQCGRRRYLPVSRGYYPKPVSHDGFLAKSQQYFGSGAGAFRLVIGSQQLYRLLRDAKIKGIEFKACAD